MKPPRKEEDMSALLTNIPSRKSAARIICGREDGEGAAAERSAAGQMSGAPRWSVAGRGEGGACVSPGVGKDPTGEEEGGGKEARRHAARTRPGATW